jgi:AraC-like DNA-binding protein
VSRVGLRADSTRAEYDGRVNRVVDYIRSHLGEALTLGELARIAAFSPFHFHRVFSALTGETLFAYIQRQRIEKAAGVLAAGVDPTILEVALDHGFSSAATFARAFRARFGMSASEWRRGGAERWREPYLRKMGKQIRKAGKASGRRRPDTPPTHTREAAMGVVVVPPGFAADRWVNLMDVPGGRYAVTAFHGTAHQIEGVWHDVFADWLPGSGYQPDDRACFETYRGAPPSGSKTGAFRCDLCLPVRPL